MNKIENSMYHSSAHKRVRTEVALWRPDWGQSSQQEETEVKVTSALEPYGSATAFGQGQDPDSRKIENAAVHVE